MYFISIFTDKNDTDQERNWQHEQQIRRDTIKHLCTRLNSTHSENFTTEVLRHVLVSDQSKVLYCYVPKVACSNWKRILLILSGINVTNVDVHTTNIPSLLNFSPEGVRRRLRDYTKLIIVRNPHERLLSAFNDKFRTKTVYTIPAQKRFAPIMRNHIYKRSSI